jgi:hypothetical protein
MKTHVLQVDERFGEEYAGKYVFKEISWARRSRIIQKHTKYSQITGQVVNSDYVTIQAETIWASIKEQPAGKPISFEKLLGEEDGIPIGLGEIFSQIVNHLNGISLDETRFLSEPSADTNQTHSSQTSVCAKNSGGPQTSSPNSQQRPSNASSQSSTS